ncbi:unnamed protein product [Bursaphelenchus xylophilus]|uniref:(pine wood nematode) hypothetical protein n=1 Tax=Bursaphelenchus xylophilus TaxID=6326 RepID=A0A1I7RQG7_BURXY|nr:unnamed protein product [Bursaphelenchus xylophilus]CAG9104547.1 unnamed protein product [Bursaphelenchus xylophilus]
MLLLCLFASLCISLLHGFIFPEREFVSVNLTIECTANLSTILSLRDLDVIKDDVLATIHITEPGTYLLEGTEKEYGTFEPYIEVLGTCNGIPHNFRHMIQENFIYKKKADRKVYGHTVRLD